MPPSREHNMSAFPSRIPLIGLPEDSMVLMVLSRDCVQSSWSCLGAAFCKSFFSPFPPTGNDPLMFFTFHFSFQGFFLFFLCLLPLPPFPCFTLLLLHVRPSSLKRIQFSCSCELFLLLSYSATPPQQKFFLKNPLSSLRELF